MTVIQNFLSHIVDYAGLFPPAALPLDAVIKNFEAYAPGNHRWMLGRLIIPASKLGEFAKTYSDLYPNGLEQPPWKISALIPSVNAENGAFAAAMKSIAAFNSQHSYANVDTVEGKLPSPELVSDTSQQLLDGLSAFLEIPWQAPNPSIQELSKSGRDNTFAKIRTGGVTTDLIPDPERVANFIHACAAFDLGFKATAGLHHPVRGQFPLTYKADADRGTMHGFLNVFLAACFAAKRDWSVEQLTNLLTNQDPALIRMTDETIEYGGHSISDTEIQQVRNDFAISFGSCSFVEPIDDLVQLGWLADSAKTV